MSEQVQWWTNWYVTRRHAVIPPAGEWSEALCGSCTVRPDDNRLRSLEWQQNRLSVDPPKCKHCIREVEKLGFQVDEPTP